MALHWDVSKVENYQHITTKPWTRGTEDPEWHGVTNAIIMLSMVCGYGRVTEENYKKVAKRIAAYQLVCGAYMGSREWPQIYVTEEDVKMHIGLSVNVTPITDAAWMKKLARMVDENATTILTGQRNTREGPIGDIADAKTLSGYEIHERIGAMMARDKAKKEAESKKEDAA